MNYFGPNKRTFFDDTPFFEHRAKNGTANSTSKEKGTDGKNNNTSEYNHKYYEKNKARWQKKADKNGKRTSLSTDDDHFYDENGKPKFGHVDIDENDWDAKREGKKIEGTNLKIVTSSDGGVVVVGNGIKFRFPPGTKIDASMEKKLAVAESGDKTDKAKYVANMLNAVTGYYDKEKAYEKKQKKTKSSSEKAASDNSKEKSSDKTRTFDEVTNDYYDKKKKK